MAESPRHPEGTGLVMATFRREEAATRALEDLLDAGFLNVEREAADGVTEVLVDPDGREREATSILSRYGGVRVDLGR